MLQTLVHIFTK